jgi:hypothetical protein
MHELLNSYLWLVYSENLLYACTPSVNADCMLCFGYWKPLVLCLCHMPAVNGDFCFSKIYSR